MLNNGLAGLSYLLAAMSGIFFISGIAVLTGGRNT